MEQKSCWETDSVITYSRKFLFFMETEGSLLCPQEPTTGLYSQLDESSAGHFKESIQIKGPV
jgi:hypothetical protein